jgi:prepilin-type N-terminal cleavage/methylation domain-containing protein
MKTNTWLKKLRRIKSNKCFNSETGFTILELLVSLSILSLLTVTLLSTGFTSKDPFSDAACEAECEKILYALLQHQNEAIMDGYQRQVRFGKTAMQVIWTKAGVNYRDYIPVETLTFTGDYTGAAALTLHQHGTVSQGGTVYLTGYNGVVRKIVVQVGNGRIYLDEP